MYFILGRFWDGVPEEGILLAFLTLFFLLLVGTIGLAVAAIVLEILRLLLLREEWEADANRLEVRWRLLGFSWNGTRLSLGRMPASKLPAGESAASCLNSRGSVGP